MRGLTGTQGAQAGPDAAGAAGPAPDAAADALNEAATQLLGCRTADEVYDVATGFMRRLCPDGVVVVNETSPDAEWLVTRRVAGLDDSLVARAARVVGFEIVGKRSAVDPRHRRELLEGRLCRIDGGFVELAAAEVPRAVAKAGAQMFRLADAYSIGITDGARVLGNIQLYTRAPGVALPAHAVEPFARHCYSALEAVRTLAELRDQQQTLTAVLDAVPLAVFWKDRDGVYLGCNPSFAKAAGLGGPGDVVGRTDGELPWSHEQAQAFGAADRDVLQTGTPQRGIVEQGLTPDGTPMTVLKTKVPLRDARGEPYAVVGAYADVTELVETRRALELSEAKFATAFKASPDAVNINRASDGLYLEISEGFTRLTGYTAADVAGKTSAEIGIWADPGDRERLVQGLREHGSVAGLEAQFRRKDGTLTTALMSASLIVVDDEPCILSITRDISRRKAAEEALAESERFSSQIVESAGEGVIVFDRDLRYRVWNPYMEALTGTPAADVLGRRPEEVFPRLAETAVLETVRTVLRTGERAQSEHALGPPRESTWVLDTSTPLRNAAGETVGVINVVQNVTARRRAGEELRSSERMFRVVADNTFDWEYWVDPAGRFVYCSPSCERVTGYAAAEFLRDAGLAERIVHPDDRALRRAHHETVSAGEVVHRVVRPDGEVRWMRHECHEIFDTDGTPLGRRSSNRDITEQILLAEELRRSELQYRDLVERSPEAIFTHSGGRILYVNPAGLALLGAADPADLLGTPVIDRVHPDFRELVSARMAGMDRDDDSVPVMEERFLRLDGTSVDVEVSASVTRTPEGAVIEVVARDISARKRAERELDETNRRLEATLRGIIETMGSIVEARDPYTRGHEQRAAALARAIAEEMGLGADDVEGVEVAALVHDLGKLAVPAEILTRPGAIPPLEFELVKAHARAGSEMLRGIEFTWPVAEAIAQHHERLDGSGYPAGLAGDQILLGARIIAVADVAEAMASHRPYRPALGVEAALEELRRGAGTRYDAQVVECCLRCFEQRGFTFDAVPDPGGYFA